MNKSPDAFRTISEVSDWLDTPAHVLRFWESKFAQIKPVKRAGGRRYYRPEDMALLAGIKSLLHEQGMTIKGVQKLLREKGVRHVAGLGPDGATVDEDAFAPDETVARDAMARDDMAGDDLDGDAPPPDPAAAARPVMPAPVPPPATPTATLPPAPPMHAARPAQLAPIVMPQAPARHDPGMASTPSPAPAPAPQAGPPPMPPRMNQRPPPDVSMALPVDRPAAPGLLSQIARAQPQTIAARRARILPVLARLAVLRDRMAQDQA